MDLAELLTEFEDEVDPRLLVGVRTSDDAGVFAISDDLALVLTADVITPMTDDPHLFGQVAAANALSDIYAMGGRPLTALNLAFFPSEGVPEGVLAAILKGAREKVKEAGATVVGGHTVRDDEVKFGLSVTGTCHPQRYLPNSGARPGDLLVLTKPIGTGVLFAAYRRDWVGDEAITGANRGMAALNDVAAEEALAHDAGGATDITGFGLAGHAREMARGSGVALRLWFDRIPRYPGVLDMIERGAGTGLTRANWDSAADLLRVDEALSEAGRMLLVDPQTSGGLLVSLPASRAEAYVGRLHEAGVAAAAIIGEVLEGPASIEVVARAGG